MRTGAGDGERNTTLPVFAVDPVSPDADSPYRGGNYDLLKLLAGLWVASAVRTV